MHFSLGVQIPVVGGRIQESFLYSVLLTYLLPTTNTTSYGAMNGYHFLTK